MSLGLEPTAPRAGLTSGALLILALGRDLLVTRFLARGGRLRRMTFAILFLPRVLTRRFGVEGISLLFPFLFCVMSPFLEKMWIVDGVCDHVDHRFRIASVYHYDGLVHIFLRILLQMEQETIEDSCVLILSCSLASCDHPMQLIT